MIPTLENKHATYRPDPDSVFTVHELIEILLTCPSDALITVGKGLDDCEDNIERVIVGKNTILFATEPND